MKSVNPGVRVVACSPENSCVMIESIKAGRVLEIESRPTLSDGTAGGIESGTITFDLCRSLIDEFVLVSEAEIAETMRSLIESHHQLIEGSAAVPLAAVRKVVPASAGENTVVVLCGGNVSLETLRAIL